MVPFKYACIVLLIAACTTTRRTDLFFGMNIPDGGEVTDDQWKKFNDSIVSPRFPEGYTEWNAAGKWMDTETKRTITENTKVLTFIGKRSKTREGLLDSVMQYYISQYKQQAVLRIDSKAKVKFINSQKLY